jgi:transcriptional regulator with XRE-family HTH domain
MTKDIDKTDLFVGSRVRARRRELRMSQTALADGLGLTFQQVQKYERGANRISASKLYEIAGLLEVPVAYFFDGLEHGVMASDGLASKLIVAQNLLPGLERIPELDTRRRKALGSVLADMLAAQA